MHAPDGEAGRVVSAVFREGSPLVLVEDTWTEDTENSPPESRRTWRSSEGAQVTTMTSQMSLDSPEAMAERVLDALSGAAMEHQISVGTPREAMILAVRRARAADVRDDARCLMVDGTPYGGVSASSEGTTVRGVRVDTTVIVTVTDSGPVTVALGPP